MSMMPSGLRTTLENWKRQLFRDVEELIEKYLLNNYGTLISGGKLTSGAQAGIDHGNLAGLADDDHTNLLNETRHDLLDHTGLPGVGGGGAVATDEIWDALGDLAYGSGANTGAKLAGNTTTTRKFLRQTGDGGASAAPAWDTLQAGDYPDMGGDAGAGGTKGAVPAPGAGDAAAGKYLKADGTWTTPPAGGGGSVATDTIFDAKGDLAVGTGSDTAARLAVGANGYLLIADSGEAAGMKWVSSNLKLHLDSDLGITKDVSDLVSLWADQGSSGNNLTQGTGTNQPLWVDAVINSRPVVRFDGNDNYMSRLLSASGFPNLSLVIVVRPRDASAAKGILSWASGLTSGTPFMIVQRDSTNLKFYMNNGYRFTVAHATDATHLYVLTWDGATWTLYTDGGAGSTYSGGGTYTSSTTLYLGNGYNGYAYVEIPELMLYDKVLSTAERQALETALISEYGIA